MSTSFDIDGLMAAAGEFSSAADAGIAGAALANVSLGPAALGSTPTAAALESALQGFGANQRTAASASAQALSSFAQRLQAVAGIGTSAVAETSAAAAGG